MSNLEVAQKYYNVARAICRTCTAEYVSVKEVRLTIDKTDHETLLSMVGKYPPVQMIDG